jgi:D-cysteine desulfhydrase family pyridoxal phosphate-dependent enzyme
MQIGQVRRKPIALLPTPLQELPRLTRKLGAPRLFVKRDDLTDLALGGNKLRKLEYALAEAEAAGATCAITSGAVQSNHCRLTVAACNLVGLPCHVVLRGDPPPYLSGNLFLDCLLGAASLRFVQDSGLPSGPAQSQTPVEQAVDELRADLVRRGQHPFVIPNGCTPLHGALGYAHCVREIVMQLHERNLAPDWLVTACGSAGTQTGLILGSELFCGGDTRVVGMSVGQPKQIQLDRIAAALSDAYAFLGIPEPEHNRIVHDRYIGPGYGLPSRGTIEAIRLAASLEGLILDPVYTGKAMAGLIDLIRNGEIGTECNVVLLHTGGVPGLFAVGQAERFGLPTEWH